MLDLLLWPFAAGLILTGIHAYFGQHVLARGIIFVDLSLAQVAALGVTVAILAGHTVQSPAAYWYALSFAVAGAVTFALARRFEHLIPQEAVIGIVYAVCAALGVLALDRAPQGAEHIKQILIGSILTIGAEEVGQLALLYGAVGLLHWLLRRPLIAASFGTSAAGGASKSVFWWDVVFYGSFAVVVTSSVRIAGVLLVFSYLIVPAAIAGVFVRSMRKRLLVAWILGAVLTAVGLGASWAWDLPTGPAIVAAFGAATALLPIGYAMRYVGLRHWGVAASSVLAFAGALLLAFPQMDQPWLDTVEDAFPIVHTTFLTPHQRQTRQDAIADVARASAELAKLRALQEDVRWGRQDMPEEKQERMRQYIAGRSEILAGDQMVLKELRIHARNRQRIGLGLPMLILGVIGCGLLLHRRQCVKAGNRALAAALGCNRLGKVD